ncbi:MAG: hypothetical protein M3P52_00315, partial [Actinomycetota bacterium]|nr:hypothetical protein [Actinomycetota bacterium]
MMRWLRRLFWLVVFAGGGYGGYRVWSRRQSPPSASPEWPPLPSVEKDDRVTPATPAAPRWVAPVDGQNPEGYPVKANDTSRIFHVPGGRFYARTAAERCYAHT